ncbi:hypothetical protein [Magnetospirillum molischianum]|uniref:Lipoprotein n=1 Tax=Magnetospirillum molischianum DSM 120 TaxID=1150626 RepID=H8FUN2_MAGML|nr:hypothetical protein [Magnetospirillum molischianum]CCG42070.1 conserved exported hypothetical protein [Magnetospirillum molischianum DSM 120]
MTGRSGLCLALVLSLCACTYDGGDIGNPFTRKVQWYSFIGGDDIQASCAAGSAEQVRLVYNAVWGEQVRIYEWDGGTRDLRIRVIGPGNLTGLTSDDILAPWRAVETRVPLSAEARTGLDTALAEAGGFGPPAVGLDLPSHGYYWAAATCRDGRFTFTGWRWPSDSFAAARFPALLFALDPSRAEVRPPADQTLDLQWEDDVRRGVAAPFLLSVGRNGRVR